MAHSLNDPFAYDQDTPQLAYTFSTPTNASFPTLFDYGADRDDTGFPPPPQTTRLPTTADSSRPTVSLGRGRSPSAPASYSRPAFRQIAEAAQVIRNRWLEEATAAAMQPTTIKDTDMPVGDTNTATKTSLVTTRPTHVDFADQQLPDRSRPPVKERRSSLCSVDVSAITPTTPTTSNPTRDVMARMAVNDSAFTPKAFRGVEADSDRTEAWIDYFNTYTSFRDIRGHVKLQLFKLLLTEQAADWLRSLDETVTDDYGALLKAFRLRYLLTDLDRWRKGFRCRVISVSFEPVIMYAAYYCRACS